MNTKRKEKKTQKKLRWSAALLLAGFVLGSLLPSLERKVQAAPHQAAALDVVINEIAWMGTEADSNDEWIELYNPTGSSIDLSGWNLIADETAPNISLSGTIPAGGYFLLERTDDTTISDITADLIYTGAMVNGGEVLRLYDNSATPVEIDTANISGGAWLAGDNTTKASMERTAVVADSPSAWADNDGVTINGLDAGPPPNPPNPIIGTPGQPNSVSSIPLDLHINEVAWAGTVASADDEWIELYSSSGGNFDLTDWYLVADDGSSLYIVLEGFTSADGYFLLERERTNVVTNVEGFDGGDSNQIYSGVLSDSGAILRLHAPDGTIIDTANSNGGAWPGGELFTTKTMERVDITTDTDASWETWGTTSSLSNGKDAAGNEIFGSPGYPRNTLATETPTASSTPTVTSTATATMSPTVTMPPTATVTPPASLTILINEVAWSGTKASGNDQWIELYNNSNVDIDLTDWQLKASDGTPLITFNSSNCTSPSCIIPQRSYFLLERTDDTTVDDIAADLIYTGALEVGGEYLQLISAAGTLVDSANKNGGAWSAGSGSPNYASMERSGVVVDSDWAWFTHAGAGNGFDALGNPINGTPKQANWATTVTVTPSPKPTLTSIPPSKTPTPYPFQAIVLNEVLARPGHDWNGDGVVDVYDEFIEIINRGTTSVNLQGWKLDDGVNGNSATYTLPSTSLEAGERIAIFGSTSRISLSDGGETVRLLKSSNQISDVVTYTIARAADQSWCRFPEHGFWNVNCFPTPSEENSLQGENNGDFPASSHPVCSVPDTVPAIIVLIECGDLGMGIYDADFWNYGFWGMELTGHAKYSTWFR